MIRSVDTELILGRAYQARVIDAVLAEALEAAGAVLIEGARACGKTMTALNAAASFEFMDEPQAEQLREVSPTALLEGERPRLLDEWQLAPELWNMVRRAVDSSPKRGNFILTGSAAPADDITRHTGAGRFLRIQQRTMSWFEKGVPWHGGTVSLEALFDGETPTTDAAAPDLEHTITALLRPGFPGLLDTPPKRARALLNGYLDDVARTDLPRMAAIRHEPFVIRRLIAALARSVASEVSFTTLAKDVNPAAPGITAETISSYVQLLRRVFVVDAQTAWTPRLRSRARLRISAKMHLADAALAAVALGANAGSLVKDLPTTGLLFESAAIHDLAVLSSPLEGQIHHYRDSNGREIDAVITLPDGRWATVEVKLGGLQVRAGAESLARAVADIDTDAVGEPAFRLVLTGTGSTFTLTDGTVTCPLAALRP
jgi:predicted AAA+ superfamily ATPase